MPAVYLSLRLRTALALLALLALLVSPSVARAENLTCTPISTVPTAITVPGIYCLTGPLSLALAMGIAIDIQASNVVLDLNGFKLGNLSAGRGTVAVGIHADNRENLTIKNGTIRGFLFGIKIEDTGGSQGHVIEDIRADRNTLIGIEVHGSGIIVRNNQVVATGGTTSSGDDASAIGLYVTGTGPRVLNNDVINTMKQGAGTASGIFLTGTDVLAVNNRITRADSGIDYAGSSGKYRDNLTSNTITPYANTFNAVDAGNNH